LVDSGYTGIIKFYESKIYNNKIDTKNILIPDKKRKGQKLTKEQKEHNTEISKERIVVENVISFIKRFRVVKDTYRCRRKRFNLRFNLIAGICNYES